MRSWLAAAHAEMCAHTGDHHGALIRFDQADALLPDDSIDPTMPYLSLDRTHLTRWRGHGLAILGDAEAIDYLTRALDQLDRSFVRARIRFARRPCAGIPRHRRTRSGPHARARRKQIAMQIGSERNRRRVLAPPRAHLKNLGHNSFSSIAYCGMWPEPPKRTAIRPTNPNRPLRPGQSTPGHHSSAPTPPSRLRLDPPVRPPSPPDDSRTPHAGVSTNPGIG